MNEIVKKAEEMAHAMVRRGVAPEQAFDPATIAALIYIIIELVKLWRTCQRGPDEALNEGRRLGLRNRLFLRLAVLRCCKERGLEHLFTEVYASTRDAWSSSTAQSMKTVFSEVAP